MFLNDIFNLFFVDVCLSCSDYLVKNEQVICLKCRFNLPFAELSNYKDNVVEKAFYGRVKIEFATALFYYQSKSPIQEIIHQLKYKSQEKVGEIFGDWLGAELKSCKRLQKVNYIVPVPVDKRKLKQRGYNQNTLFAKQLALHLDAVCNENVLQSFSKKETQTKKTRLDRILNVSEKFYVSNFNELEGKHILLVDDVITTGATIEACVNELKKINGVKISIAAMAYTL